jgi:hypothetical protein
LADFSNISVTGSSTGATTASAASADSPEAALRRLHLPEPTGDDYRDVVQLDPTDRRGVARQVDDERVELERSHQLASAAIAMLTAMDGTLEDVAGWQKANAAPGTPKQTRRENQAKLDEALQQIDEALKTAGTESEKLFTGSGATLRAGRRTVAVEPLSLDTLGRVTENGKTASLADLARRAPLDTTRRSRGAQQAARRTIERAQEQSAALREKLQAFEEEVVRPRTADVAVAMAGVYDSTVGGLGSTDEALDTARKLRKLMLDSATAAVAVGANGWDRERVLALITG